MNQKLQLVNGDRENQKVDVLPALRLIHIIKHNDIRRLHHFNKLTFF